MKQRAVALVADYLSKRPTGRVVRVMKSGEDDSLMGIEDVRDGSVQSARPRHRRHPHRAPRHWLSARALTNDVDVGYPLRGSSLRLSVSLLRVIPEASMR
jgi:hypothetical protein